MLLDGAPAGVGNRQVTGTLIANIFSHLISSPSSAQVGTLLTRNMNTTNRLDNIYSWLGNGNLDVTTFLRVPKPTRDRLCCSTDVTTINVGLPGSVNSKMTRGTTNTAADLGTILVVSETQPTNVFKPATTGFLSAVASNFDFAAEGQIPNIPAVQICDNSGSNSATWFIVGYWPDWIQRARYITQYTVGAPAVVSGYSNTVFTGVPVCNGPALIRRNRDVAGNGIMVRLSTLWRGGSLGITRHGLQNTSCVLTQMPNVSTTTALSGTEYVDANSWLGLGESKSSRSADERSQTSG